MTARAVALPPMPPSPAHIRILADALRYDADQLAPMLVGAGCFLDMSYEERVSLGQLLVASSDSNNWALGYLALSLTDGSADPKGHVLQDFAAQIGSTPASLREKLDCAAFWRPEDVLKLRASFPENPPSWSHFNRARRNRSLDEATALVSSAAEESLSVRAMESSAPRTPVQEGAILRAALNALERVLNNAHYGADQKIVLEDALEILRALLQVAPTNG